MTRRVAIESRFRGATPDEQARNAAYLRACIQDCVRRGESPYASHRMLAGMLDGALDDDDPVQRDLGIQLGFAWADLAEARVVYTDLGTSLGMQLGIARGRALGQAIELRKVEGWTWPPR